MGKTGKNRKAAKKRTDKDSLSLVGPDFIQTLRGRALGKEVALILCGESHNEAIDLTRARGVLEPRMGWVKLHGYAGGGWDPADAVKSKSGLPLGKALEWAAQVVEGLDDEDGFLVWEGASGSKGVATVYDSDAERSFDHCLGESAVVYEWDDLDAELRELNERRLAGIQVEQGEHDALMERRKEARQREGIELFDDWLLRHAGASSAEADSSNHDDSLDIHLVLEATVPASEVELHHDDSAGAPPQAAKCIRCLEQDSEASSDEDDDPSANSHGTDYLDYLYRRAAAALPCGALHCIDMRDLGDKDSATVDWRSLLTPAQLNGGLTKVDPEEAVLSSKGFDKKKSGKRELENAKRRVLSQDAEGKLLNAGGTHVPVPDTEDVIRVHGDGQLRDAVDWSLVDSRDCDMVAWGQDSSKAKEESISLPCFEGFFGQPSELLYYSLHSKACFSPFLARSVRSMESWNSFFQALFFGGTIPEALSVLDLSQEARACSWVRSPIILKKGGTMERRDDEESKIECPYLPIDCYLKAKASNPPRTWISDLFAKVAARDADSASLATDARQWILDEIAHVSKDPKAHDDQDHGGEWFVAWLREMHRDIYDDIDRSDPSELLRKKWVARESGEGKKKADRRCHIGEIKIPSCNDGFTSIVEAFSPVDAPTRRADVLAKIIIDIWMLRLVDYAAILKVIDAVAQSPRRRVVVVCYLGSQHTQSLVEFWRARGFTEDGLPAEAFIGKTDFEDDECRKLELPPYLCDFTELFPLPNA